MLVVLWGNYVRDVTAPSGFARPWWKNILAWRCATVERETCWCKRGVSLVAGHPHQATSDQPGNALSLFVDPWRAEVTAFDDVRCVAFDLDWDLLVVWERFFCPQMYFIQYTGSVVDFIEVDFATSVCLSHDLLRSCPLSWLCSSRSNRVRISCPC